MKRALSKIVLILLLFIFTGTQKVLAKESETARESFNRGIDCYEHESKIDSALQYFNDVIRITDYKAISKEDAFLRIKSLENLSYLYITYYYNYESAYKYIQQAQEDAIKYDYPAELPYILLNKASIIQYLDDDQTDITHIEEMISEALEGAYAHNQSYLIIPLTITLMEPAFRNGQISDKDYELIMRTQKRKNAPEEAGEPQLNCYIEAVKAIKNQEYGEALQYLKKATEMPNEAPYDSRFACATMLRRAKLFKIAGMEDSVPHELLKVVDLAKKDNSKEYMLSAYKELANYYQAIDNQELQRHYNYEYLALLDSMKRVQDLTSLKIYIDSAANEKEKSGVESRVITPTGWLGIILATLGMAIAIYFWVKNSKKNRGTQTHSPTNPNDMDTPLENKKKYPVRLTEEKVKSIYASVEEVMKTSKEIFAQDFSITRLSQMIDVPYYDISTAINEMTGDGFKQLLIKYRIEEACRLMKDPETIKTRTIESIALDLGFKSRPYFNTVFKKATGYTPSVYMSLHQSGFPKNE